MTFLDFNLGFQIIPAQSWLFLAYVLKVVLDALNSGEHAFGLFATQGLFNMVDRGGTPGPTGKIRFGRKTFRLVEFSSGPT